MDARSTTVIGPRSAADQPDRTPDGPETELTAVPHRSPSVIRGALSGLRSSRLGLVAMALFVGGGAGLGSVGFRWLINAFTWVVTGRQQFGQQGRVSSLHLPFLGIWFLLLVPVVGGLIYGPLIQRFAKEARGHGVPEVMLAVAENGGRIRPQVSLVKALASALCIGVGGSVGREGPIVQIGSAFASSIGQWVRMSESRLRILVACGAAGGISATFNAPITGLFFGFEIILREFSLDALLAVILSSVAADLVSQAFFGSAPFFSAIPHDLLVRHGYTYLLMALLGVAAGLIGFGFKTALYRSEDLVARMWQGRPEWALPAVGGIALGAVLLAMPQLYGVGYPVLDNAIGGHTVSWLLVALMLGKILAVSLTLSIGGSGGVFAPSLFIGAMAGTAFGVAVQHIFGPVVSSPAVFGVVAMGAVFGGAAQAPLTAIASVVEMTGNFTLILPVMLAVGIAAAVSKKLSYGSIYTTKLLRRGVDIERPKPANVLQMLTVSDAMLPLPAFSPRQTQPGAAHRDTPGTCAGEANWADLIGPVSETRRPQAIFADESLDQALRQLVLYGRAGLPVLSPDGQHLRGWITRTNVLRVLAERVSSSEREAEQGRLATEFSDKNASSRVHQPRTPLDGYQIVELTIPAGSPGVGKRLDEVGWPAGSQVVAVTEGRELVTPRDDIQLRPGERIVLLVPIAAEEENPFSAAPEPPRSDR